MIDEELSAVLKQFRQGFSAVAPLKNVLLVHPFPRKLTPLLI